MNVGDVQEGTSVATRTHTGNLEWHRVQETVRTHFSGDLVVADGRRSAAFAVTPNHRLSVCSQYEAKKSKRGRTQFIEAGTFADGGAADQYWIPTIADPLIDGDAGVGEDLAYFIGFYLAEGCRSITRGRKYAHVDNTNRQLLLDLAGSLGFKNEPYKTNGECYRLSLRSDELFDLLGEKQRSWEKRIPRHILKRGSETELFALFDGMMDGDGTWSQSKYDTVSEGLADDFQELVARLGLCATKSQTAGLRRYVLPTRAGIARPIWRISYRKPDTSHRYYYMKRSRLKREHYDGDVVCVVVPPNHTILTRLNGRTTWIGQSFDAARYGVMTLPEPDEVKTDDPDAWVRDIERKRRAEPWSDRWARTSKSPFSHIGMRH
jgi:hypothetical protein